MKNELELNPGNYEHFKDQRDPVTLAPFQLGDVLVRCRYCHRTYQKVTVESMGGKCPGPSCPSGSGLMETEPVAVRRVVLKGKRNVSSTNKVHRIPKAEPQPNTAHRIQQRSGSSRQAQRFRKLCAALTLLSGIGLTVSILALTCVCLFGGKAEAFLALLSLVGVRFRLRILVPLGGLLGALETFYQDKLGGLRLLWNRVCQLWETTLQDILRDPAGTLLAVLSKMIQQKE